MSWMLDRPVAAKPVAAGASTAGSSHVSGDAAVVDAELVADLPHRVGRRLPTPTSPGDIGGQGGSGGGPGPVGERVTAWGSVRLLVVFAVPGGLSPLEPPVDLVGVRVPPLAHPVLEAR